MLVYMYNKDLSPLRIMYLLKIPYELVVIYFITKKFFTKREQGHLFIVEALNSI